MAAFILKENRARNRPLVKQSREALERGIGLHDRNLAVSTEIRSRCGLEPLVDNEIVRGWRAKLAELGAKPTRKRAPKRLVVLTPADQVYELARQRARVKREARRIDTEIGQLVADGSVPARKIADALGVSRQRVYQLAT